MSTRTFRIFISSTFEDLVEERNALQLRVFPYLRNLCEAQGTRFEPVDLRWGVSDEAVIGHRLIDICFTEIERCQREGTKPNFIILVGDRYGRPVLPARIPADEFETLLLRSPDSASRSLIENWYQRDENALPSEYLLKPRPEGLTNREAWESIENQVRRALHDAASSFESKESTRVKYHGSATHQEIIKGLGANSKDRKHVFALLRDAQKPGPADPRLEQLKGFLRQQLGENVRTYDGGNLDQFCAVAAATLEKGLVEELASGPASTALAVERKAQRAFARDRRRFFKGREQVLNSILDHLQGVDNRPLVLQGVSGCGKSAILAQAAALGSARRRTAVSIRRFVGVTPASSSGISLLQSVCEEIATNYDQPTEIPMDFSLVIATLRDYLERATADRPLWLFVDALDQLDPDDPARTLAWVPTTLPPNCRIVVSTNYQPLPFLDVAIVNVDLLSPNDAEAILQAWLNAARRTLRPAQRDLLLEHMKRSGLPLYC